MKKVFLLAWLFVNLARGSGGPGSALNFINTSRSVTVPHTNALNAFPLTVMAWVQITPPDPVVMDLVKKFDEGANGWRLRNFNGFLAASYSANSASYIGSGNGLNGPFLADGSWHHVAMTVDANGGRLYMDGQLSDSQVWTGTPGAPTTTSDLKFGATFGPNMFIGMLLDEVTVWNVGMSQSQINAMKNRSLAGNEAGLLAYYRCDEASGSIVTDSAPAAGINNGSLVGVFFVSSGIIPFTPFAETLPVSNLGPTNATLNGTVNPEGTNTGAWFEWGVTTNYGNSTPVQVVSGGTANLNFNQLLPSLFPGGTVYQFRAVASNHLGVAYGTNQTFALNTFFMFEPSTTFGGSDGWLAPGEGGYAYLGTNGLERGLAFGNDHLYLVSRSGGNNVRILHKLTGADMGALNTNGISGGTFDVNMIGAGGDGVIYVANLTGDASTLPYKVYAWTNENSPPVLRYSGTPLAGARIGDSLSVIGTGSSTLLAAGFNEIPAVPGNNGFAIINPTLGMAAPVSFAGSPPTPGDFRFSLSFIDSGRIYGASAGAAGKFRYTSFSGTNGMLLASPSAGFNERLLAHANVGGMPLLAVQDTATAGVTIFDATDPANPIALVGGNNTSGTLIANASRVGQVVWGDFTDTSARLYALGANQGIQAFLVRVFIQRPTLSATRLGTSLVLSWPTNAIGFSLQSSTNLAASTAWIAASPAPVISGNTYFVTNSTVANALFYRLKK